jgi:hypothetical protein
VTPRETNVFLTEAALLDPRMKRVNEVEQADMASMWADVLADVSLADARAAMRAHYRSQTIPMMPAHVLERVVVVDEMFSRIPDVTDQVIAESKARALEAAGVTEDEFEAHQHDAAWIRAHFPTVETPAVAAWADENGELE